MDDLQSEKALLAQDNMMLRAKLLQLVGLGDMTYPPESRMSMGPEDKLADEPRGKHVSIIGLRAARELRSREEAAKKAKEQRDAPA